MEKGKDGEGSHLERPDHHRGVKDGVNYHEGSSQEDSSKLWVKILDGRQMGEEERQSLEEILGTGHVTSATPNTFIHSYKACPMVLEPTPARLAVSSPGLAPVPLPFLKASFPNRGQC